MQYRSDMKLKGRLGFFALGACLFFWGYTELKRRHFVWENWRGYSVFSPGIMAIAPLSQRSRSFLLIAGARSHLVKVVRPDLKRVRWGRTSRILSTLGRTEPKRPDTFK